MTWRARCARARSKAPIHIDLAALPIRQDASEERQGRVADPALQRSQAPSCRRRDGQCLGQRIAGAALRRTRRVPHASALGRRLNRALWPPWLFPHARRNYQPRMAATRALRATRIMALDPRSATTSSLSCGRSSSRRNDANRRSHPRRFSRPRAERAPARTAKSRSATSRSCMKKSDAAGLAQRLRRPMGILRRRRRGGVRLRRLGLSLGVPRGRQESGATVRQQIEARRPAQFEEKPLDIGADAELSRKSSAPIRSTSTATATWICSC